MRRGKKKASTRAREKKSVAATGSAPNNDESGAEGGSDDARQQRPRTYIDNKARLSICCVIGRRRRRRTAEKPNQSMGNPIISPRATEETRRPLFLLRRTPGCGAIRRFSLTKTIQTDRRACRKYNNTCRPDALGDARCRGCLVR